MKTYKRTKRSTARRWLRWLVAGRVQVDDLRVMVALTAGALALLASTSVASAQTRWDYCREIPHGTVCVNKAAKVTRITCDWGYQPRFGSYPRCVAMGG